MSFSCLKIKDKKKNFAEQNQPSCHGLPANNSLSSSALFSICANCSPLRFFQLTCDSSLLASHVTFSLYCRVFDNIVPYINRILFIPLLSFFLFYCSTTSIHIHSNTAYNNYSVSTGEKHFLRLHLLNHQTFFHFDIPRSFFHNQGTSFHSENG